MRHRLTRSSSHAHMSTSARCCSTLVRSRGDRTWREKASRAASEWERPTASARFVLGNLAEALFLAGEWGEAEALASEGSRARCCEPAGSTTSRSYRASCWGELRARPRRLVRALRRPSARRRRRPLARERGDDQTSSRPRAVAAWMLVRDRSGRRGRVSSSTSCSSRAARIPTGVMPRVAGSPTWRSRSSGSAARRRACADLDEPTGRVPRGRARDRLAAVSATPPSTLRGDGSAATRGGRARSRARDEPTRAGDAARARRRVAARGRASCSLLHGAHSAAPSSSAPAVLSRRSGGTTTVVSPRASQSSIPAVDDGPRVQALRPQDARRDRGSRPGSADRDDRPVLGKVGAARRIRRYGMLRLPGM